MTPFLLGLVTSFCLAIAAFCGFLQKKKSKLLIENSKLQDELVEKTGECEIEKLKDKLSADQKDGKPAKDAYDTFRASHPELYRKDDQGE